MRTDAKTLEAYKRLVRTLDGRVMQSHLAAELENVKRQLIAAPVEQVPRLQGRAALLDEIAGLLRDESAA